MKHIYIKYKLLFKGRGSDTSGTSSRSQKPRQVPGHWHEGGGRRYDHYDKDDYDNDDDEDYDDHYDGDGDQEPLQVPDMRGAPVWSLW